MRTRLRHVLLLIALFAYTLVPVDALAVEIPTPSSTAFQQTTGRDAGLNIGDWYTNAAGGDTIHHIDVEVGCNWPATTPITVAVFDPEINTAYGNGAPYAIDEIRGTADTARFQLRSPGGGALVPWRSFTPTNGSDGRWVEILTFRPGDLPAGDRCGTFVLESEVGDGNPATPEDDDNSWRLKANHDPDCGISPGTCSTVGAASSALMADGDEVDNPDGLAGTGDELAIGYTRASQQHGGAGTTCQDYWFFDDGSTGPTFNVRNFDMDGSGSITYYPPSGSPASIPGTVSANAAWASNTLNTDLGWWRTSVCINSGNQYIFDGIAGRTVYFAVPPAEPSMSISKDDGVTNALAGDTLNWTLTFQNDSIQGSGGAPAFNVTISDTLPTGTTFSTCSIAPPLTGSCTETGGVVSFSIDQSINGQGGSSPTGGTATVSATINDTTAGVVTNTSTINYKDPFLIAMIPATDTDDTTVDPSIGDLVWDDVNGNGIQDPSEPGIDGVTVTLWDAGETTVLDSTTTAGGGRYTFTSVTPGDYVIDFGQPAGRIPTRVDVGPDSTDSDANRSTLTAAVTLGASASDSSIDAGFVAPGSIGDLVWEDGNGNGSLDGAEAGLVGVDVRLYSPGPDTTLGTPDDVLEATVTTGAAGDYLFSNLLGGDYRVDIDETTLPAGVDFNTTANEPLDLTLASGDALQTADFGYRRSAVIDIETLTNGVNADTAPGPYLPVGSTVTWTYEVTNPGLVPLTGVLVSDDGGASPLYQSGDSNTNNELDPGETWIYEATGTVTAGGFPHTGSVNGSQAIGPDVSDDDPTNHYGATGSIGDRVWNDANGNGVQDGAEPGLAGLTVELYRAADLVTPITTDITDGSGIYGFQNLIPDDYVVKFIPLAGYGLSPTGQGTAATDSDADPSSGEVAVTLALDETTGDIDAGMFAQASIGDFVFEDNDANGVFDGTDTALSGVTVELLDAAGTTVLDTTSTNGSGVYSFTTNPGSYTVRFTPSAGMTMTTTNDVAITVTSGETNDTIDAGMFTPATIGDFVFEDTDGNGVFDGTDAALSGVTVELLDAAGTTVIDTTSTNGSGNYSFSTNPGSYTVRFTPPAGMTISTTNNIAVTIASGETNDTVDAGMFTPATIGDFVFEDNDANGIFDGTDTALSGVTVELLDATGTTVLDTTTTNGSGLYSFTTNPGSYTVRFTPPAGMTLSTTNDVAVTVASGETNDTIDAGMFTPATIGDFVFEDADGNGIFDGTDAALSGVTIELLDATGTTVLDTDVTDGSGNYTFTAAPGSYTVRFTPPAGMTISTTNNVAVTVTNGETNNTIDAGMFTPATVGDFVFEDADGNGIFDGTDTALSGVTVELLDATGTTVLDTTTTNGSGNYTFATSPGSYTVRFTPPFGMTMSTTNDVAVTIASGETNNTIDAGMFSAATIGDFVFEDTDANGIFDGTDTALSGVTVELLDDTGTTVLDTDVTDGSGSYSFATAPGSYAVRFTPPAGMTMSTTNDVAVTVATGETNNSIDAGMFAQASIGDFVFEDNDANGVFDGTDTALSGVTVELLDAAGTTVLDTTSTNGSGVYSFTTNPGSYTVRFTPSAGMTMTTTNDVAITVTSGETNDTIDAGMFTPATIGDFVFEDTDGNGVFDGTDAALSGVTVELLDAAGTTVIDTTSTNGSGNYSFSTNPGSYTVRFTPPAGMTISTTNNIAVTIASGETNDTVDAGMFTPATIGDFVFEDNDANGIFDGTDTALSGVTVELLDATGTTVLDTTTTNGSGLYSFTTNPGSYTVRFTPPAGMTLSTTNDVAVTVASGETNDTIDAGMFTPATIGDFVFEDADGNGIFDGTDAALSGVTIELLDATGTTVLDTDVTDGSGNYTFTAAPGSYTVRFTPPAGMTISTTNNVAVTVTNGETNNTIDAGMFGQGTIGDLVWDDLNANGIQDPSEPGLNGITVQLLDGVTVIATDTTNASGNYSFDVDPGTYTIRFVTPAGHGLSPTGQGTPATDSNANPGNGEAAVTITSGEANDTIDAGMFDQATIGDFVFEDADANGIFDGTDTALSGVTVELLDATGTSVVDTTTTNGSGIYTFTAAPGPYTIRFTPPAGMTMSTTNNIAVTVTSGETNDTIDAGMFDDATIGDFVFEDNDANGIFDGTDTALSGVTVELLDAIGTTVLDTDVTDGTGNYTFSTNPGSYTVRFTPPAGMTISTPNDVDVTVTSGETNDTIDAGMFTAATIGDFVFEDNNANGVFDGTDTALTGVTVELLDATATTVLDTTSTDASGLYTFTAAPGSYTVRFTPPAGMTISTTNDVAVTVTSDETNNTIDAGMFDDATIGDFVFEDTDANGVFDGTDTALSGVTVELLDATGTTVLDTDVTNGSGIYTFTAAPGSYTVRFTPPAGMTISTTNDVAVTVTSGETNNTIDAGMFDDATIGDFVFEDTDANGIFDGTDTALSGVTVELLDATGTTVLDTDVTNGSGNYTFTAAPGPYTIRFTPPAGMTMSTTNNIAVTVTSGETNDTIDAGMFDDATIGDFVFEDTDANGIFDGTDTALSGVTVELLDATGTTVLDTDVTNGSGNYTFTAAPGPYTIRFTPPAGMTMSTTNDVAVTVTSGETNNTIDAGMFDDATIGDFVFEDTDANGIFDGTDAALPGVTVELLDATATTVIDITTTDGSGNYSFSTNPGSYTVRFTPPAGMTLSTTNDVAVTVTSGETNDTVDAGMFGQGTIGNLVWDDLNANGIQDPSEPGLTGITVQLLDGVTVLATDTTNGSGNYSFTADPGSYTVRFITPAGYQLSPTGQGTPATDSDPDPGTGDATITIGSGQTNDTIDAGMFTTGTIGDFVWVDIDVDGLQGAGEPGLEGMVVNLFAASDLTTPIATDTTDAAGAYEFASVAPDDYRVRFLSPGASTFTTQGAGTDPAIDSNVDASGWTPVVTVASGQTGSNLDAGILPSIIGDRVFGDRNLDGLQTPGESGVPGVQVDLLDPTLAPVLDGAGNPVTTTTDTNGFYTLAVAPGDYVVQIVTPPGTLYSIQDAGVDDSIDSDVDGSGSTGTLSVAAGETLLAAADGGIQPPLVGNYVWDDTNLDGIQDPAETGIADVTVNAYAAGDVGGTLIKSITTDADGFYVLPLDPGTYQLQIVLPADASFTTQQATAATPSTDSDVDAAGVTGPIVLGIFTIDFDAADAGIVRLGSIGDQVFLDQNGNGTFDPTEGISAVTVTLTLPDTSTQTATTDSNGAYSFTGLLPGDYTITVDEADPDFPPGTLITVGTNPSTITLAEGEINVDTDFGYQQYANLGDFVFEDADANGIFDGTDTALSGVTVELLDATGTSVVDTTTTNGSGIYTFTAAPGPYTIRFTPPAGMTMSTTNNIAVTVTSGETNDTIDAGMFDDATIGDFVFEDTDANGIFDGTDTALSGVTVELLDATGTTVLDTDVTNGSGNYTFTAAPGSYTIRFTPPAGMTMSTTNDVAVTVTSGETNNTIDAGMFDDATIGDFVFEDTDANGIFDGTDAALPGVTVELLDATATTVIDITTTDGSGNYSFSTNPGSYTVRFTPPAGMTLSTTNDVAVTVTSGETNDTVDAGMFGQGTIGNLVWDDLNANGIQDPSEPGLTGITVQLLDGVTVLATDTTNGSGNYSFTADPGSYTVRFITPAGYQLSPTGQGTPATDSDPDPGTGDATITIGSGQTNDTIDAGMFTTGTIGDFIFEDFNGNGVFDGTDAALSGITVELLDAAGTSVLDTTSTNGSGNYAFTTDPGSYTVRFTPPVGMTLGTANDVPVTVASGESDDTIDAGMFSPATIGDFTFEDFNGNGVFDGTDVALSGVTVELLDAAGTTELDTTATDGTGNYSFTAAPGSYSVRFTPPAGMTLSTANDVAVTVTSGATDDTVDAGLYAVATIAITKSGPATADVGETITYVYTVSHGPASSGSDISGVSVADADPDVTGMTLIGGDANGNSILEAAETWTYEATRTIAADDPDPLDTVATASGTDLTATLVSDTDSHPVDVAYAPVIDIQKTGPATATVGETITYTYTVTHDPTSDGSNISSVAVADADPDVSTIVLIAGDANGNDILEATETWTFEATYTVTFDDPDPLDTAASVIGLDLELDTLSDTDGHPLDIAYAPVIDIQKTGPPTATIGETIIYTYTVTHDPTSDGSNIDSIVVTDADPDVSAIVLTGGDTNSNAILEASETWTFEASYTVTVDDTDPLDTLATVIGLDPESDPVSDADGHAVDIDFAPVIDIVTGGPTVAHVSDTITYTYAVTNDSSVGDGTPIATVNVVDDLAGPATFVSGDANTNGLLEVGEIWQYQATYTVEATDPDPLVNTGTANGVDFDSEPVQDTDPHTVDILNPAVSIAITPPAQQAVTGGTATYSITVTNEGDTTLDNVTVDAPNSPSCDNTLGSLLASESVIYTCDQTITADVTNTATVTGEDPTGLVVSDTASADVDHIGPSIGVAESINGAVVNNGDGTYTLTYQIEITNSGDVDLDGVSVVQDLTSTFFGVTGFTVDAVSSPDLSVNPAYDGSTDTALLDGSDTLVPSATGTAFVTVTVVPGTAFGPHLDQVTATGIPPVGPDVTDLSDSGTNPDPTSTNPGAPGDSGGTDDPTPITFGENPVIGLAEDITEIVDNGNGSFAVTYLLTAENLGDVDLSGVQITNNLATAFSAAQSFVVSDIRSTDLTVDPAFDGATRTDLLDGTDSFAVGTIKTVEIDIIVTPGTNPGPYDNQAATVGTSPSGIDVNDTSQAGTDPDPDNDGDPTNNSTPTSVTFGSSTITGTVWIDTNGDGIVDPNEDGIDGVRVVLTCAGPDGVVGTPDDMQLQEDFTPGPYEFSGIFSGTCSVTIDTSTLPPGLTATFDSDGGNDSVTTVTAIPGQTVTAHFGYAGGFDLELVKWLADGPVDNQVTWGLNVTNVGTTASPAFEIIDTLPSSLSLIEATGPGLTCTGSGQIVTCTHQGLAAGASASMEVTTLITDTDFSVIENSGLVASLGLTAEPVTDNNRGLASLNLAALPNTGAATDIVLPIALVLLGTGIAMLLVVRRKEDEDVEHV